MEGKVKKTHQRGPKTKKRRDVGEGPDAHRDKIEGRGGPEVKTASRESTQVRAEASCYITRLKPELEHKAQDKKRRGQNIILQKTTHAKSREKTA